MDVKLRNPQTGETRTARLFELEASGIDWQPTDSDGDGWPDTARIWGKGGPVRNGLLTLRKRTVGGHGESRIHLAYENGIVTMSAATGDFAGLQLPRPGDPMPGPDDEGIEVPAVFDLQVDLPAGWEAEEITMGGGGESGQPLPVEGDVNGDGCVDDADLLIVLFNFGNTGAQGDVNNDGIVDDADLLIVLFNFGRGC